MEITIGEVKVTVDTCRHCGANPSKAPLPTILEQYLSTLETCGICSRRATLAEAMAGHEEGPDRKLRWTIQAGRIADFGTIDVTLGTVEKRVCVHRTCLRRAMPGVPWPPETIQG